ncbi:hypothetical protein BJP27_03275 [Pseudomonas oryzihabitans]|nr:hypothetical protein BJP27_03275 [Pseudomonas psychrotolerans]
MTGDRQQGCDGAGWQFVQVATDDASRLAFTSLHPDERGRSACRTLLQAVPCYPRLGIRFQRVMTDNGACYRSHSFLSRSPTTSVDGCKNPQGRPGCPMTGDLPSSPAKAIASISFADC